MYESLSNLANKNSFIDVLNSKNNLSGFLTSADVNKVSYILTSIINANSKRLIAENIEEALSVQQSLGLINDLIAKRTTSELNLVIDTFTVNFIGNILGEMQDAEVFVLLTSGIAERNVDKVINAMIALDGNKIGKIIQYTVDQKNSGLAGKILEKVAGIGADEQFEKVFTEATQFVLSSNALASGTVGLKTMQAVKKDPKLMEVMTEHVVSRLSSNEAYDYEYSYNFSSELAGDLKFIQDILLKGYIFVNNQRINVNLDSFNQSLRENLEDKDIRTKRRSNYLVMGNWTRDW
jgi:hypothetical protein